MLQSYPATERLREGYEVAIIGPPNAGKSTLLNRIGNARSRLYPILPERRVIFWSYAPICAVFR